MKKTTTRERMAYANATVWLGHGLLVGVSQTKAAAQPEPQCRSVTTLQPPSLLRLVAVPGRDGELKAPSKSAPAVQSRTDDCGEFHWEQTIVSDLNKVISLSCALIHVVFIWFGIFIPFITLAFAGMALLHVRRDTARKSFVAITENQDTAALFRNCVQVGCHFFFLVCL